MAKIFLGMKLTSMVKNCMCSFDYKFFPPNLILSMNTHISYENCCDIKNIYFQKKLTENMVPSQMTRPERRTVGAEEGGPPPQFFGKDRSKTFFLKRPWIATCPPGFSDLPTALYSVL